MTSLAPRTNGPRVRASSITLARRLGVTFVFALFAACGPSRTGEGDGASDVTMSDGSTTTHDAAIDAIAMDADASSPRDAERDVAVTDTGPETDASCFMCLNGLCRQISYCEAAVPLEPGTPLTMQDTATGGRGDCAPSPSGIGGPGLYYTLTLRAGQWTRIVATSSDPTQEPLIRVLSDCFATAVETSNRGGVVCTRNTTGTDRQVVVVVSRYSGEEQNLTIQFDLSVETPDPADGCFF